MHPASLSQSELLIGRFRQAGRAGFMPCAALYISLGRKQGPDGERELIGELCQKSSDPDFFIAFAEACLRAGQPEWAEQALRRASACGCASLPIQVWAACAACIFEGPALACCSLFEIPALPLRESILDACAGVRHSQPIPCPALARLFARACPPLDPARSAARILKACSRRRFRAALALSAACPPDPEGACLVFAKLRKMLPALAGALSQTDPELAALAELYAQTGQACAGFAREIQDRLAAGSLGFLRSIAFRLRIGALKRALQDPKADLAERALWPQGLPFCCAARGEELAIAELCPGQKASGRRRKSNSL